MWPLRGMGGRGGRAILSGAVFFVNVLILMASGATAFLAPAAFPFPGGRRDSLRPPSRLTNTAGWWVAGPRGGVRGGVALLAKAKDQEAPPPPPPGSNLQTASLSEAREVLDEVLSQQWQRALDGEKLGAGVKHVVGGFSVVVRLPDRGVAFRLQPMKNLKAGLTWVAFYSMLYEAAKDPASVQARAVPHSPTHTAPLRKTTRKTTREARKPLY